MNTSSEKWTYLKNEIEHRGIYRVPQGQTAIPAKAANDSYYWQFYLRRCLFDPKFVTAAAELLIEKLPHTNVQIGACEDAGITLGFGMSAILGSPMISLKKTRKSYGLLNFTEGRVTGNPILLVDDLAGSQDTLKKSVRLLQAFNLPVADQYVALIDKTVGTHTENYLNQRQLISLFTCNDFSLMWNTYVARHQRAPDFGPYY